MSRSVRAGLVVLGALSLIDVATPLFTNGDAPPMPIALGLCALGLASLVLVVFAWRGARRVVLPLVVLRAVSALSALPALFDAGVSTALDIAVGALLLVAAAGIVLVLTPRTAVAR